MCQGVMAVGTSLATLAYVNMYTKLKQKAEEVQFLKETLVTLPLQV